MKAFLDRIEWDKAGRVVPWFKSEGAVPVVRDGLRIFGVTATFLVRDRVLTDAALASCLECVKGGISDMSWEVEDGALVLTLWLPHRARPLPRPAPRALSGAAGHLLALRRAAPAAAHPTPHAAPLRPAAARIPGPSSVVASLLRRIGP